MTVILEQAAALRASDATDAALASLDTEQREVLRLISAGLSRAEIAAQIKVTVRRVSLVRAKLLDLLGAESNVDLAQLQNCAMLKRAEDHALIAAALCAGVAVWKPFELSGVGEVCVAGLRYGVHLDSTGVPELNDRIRRALVAALGREQRKHAA